MNIATDKRGIHIIFFLFLNKNICCGYSLEAPRRGASNEYPQHMFSWWNKKDISIFWMKKAPYLLLCVKISEILNNRKTILKFTYFTNIYVVCSHFTMGKIKI